MNMTKEDMLEMLHEKSLMPARYNDAKWTKREIAERMDCYISPSNYVSQARFQAACDWKREKREQI